MHAIWLRTDKKYSDFTHFFFHINFSVTLHLQARQDNEQEMYVIYVYNYRCILL